MLVVLPHSKHSKASKGERGFPLGGFVLRPSGNFLSSDNPEG
jgi:hypothetical protein